MKLTKEMLKEMVKETIEEQGLKKIKGKDWSRVAEMVADAEQKGLVEDVGKKRDRGIVFHEFAGQDGFFVIISLNDYEEMRAEDQIFENCKTGKKIN